MRAVAVALVACAGPLAAQATSGTAPRVLAAPGVPNGRPRADQPPTDGDDRSAAPPGAEREAEAVVAHGSPRSFQIVAVPVPPAFAPAVPVSFEVLATGSATLLGARQGVIAPLEGPSDGRSLSLTVGVPARALAGRQRVAQVRFTAPGQSDVVTPVDLDVAPVRRVDVLVTPVLVAARAGQEVPIRYRLTNFGNAVDTVHVHVESIDSSAVRPVDSDLIVLPVNAARELAVGVPLPRSTPPSVIAVEVRVVGADGEERASAQASIEVVVAARGPAGGTPALTTSLASPLGRSGAPAVALALEGPVAADMRVEGRWTRLGTDDPMAITALTRLGYYDVPPSLALATSTWRAGVGAAGARLTDLAGGAAWGVGATATLDTTSWRGAIVLAKPGLARGADTHGVLAGASASHRIGANWVTAGLAHLVEEQQTFERRLDALALGAVMPTSYDATVDAELAARRWAGGTGVGARVDVDRRTARDNATLRLLHAPGGTAAFAPSRDEISASGARVVNGRWMLAGSGWWNSDAGVIGNGMRSNGLTLQPQMTLSERTSVSLRLRSSAFAMRGAVTDISTAERDLGAVLNTRRNTLYASGTLALGTRARDSRSALTSASFHERVTRSTMEGTGGWTSAFGTLELYTLVERNVGGGTGITPDRSQVGLRADRIVINPNWPGVWLSGSMQRTGWLGERQRATLGNIALAADLPYALRATIGAQHNSFFAPGEGRWTTVLGIQRTIGLPRPQRRRGGHVFEDLNGNGRRDDGEPGFPGAVVRSAGATVATSSDGRFRLPASARPMVDSRSLPVGWLAGPTPAAGEPWSDLAVVPTSVVEVELVKAASGDGRLPRGDLASADLMARDASGRLWMARLTSNGVAVFDALPPGDYRMELDLGRIREPLTTRDPLPSFAVQAAPSRRRFTVAVIPRPLKMWRPPTSADSARTSVPPAAGGRP